MKLQFATLAVALFFTPLLFAQNMKADPSSEEVLFDFANPTNANWQIVNDDVMGGVSTSIFRITNGVAVFRGEVSLEYNGGFASVRTLPARFDLGEASEVVLRVRGDGRRYKFTARMDSSLHGPLCQSAFTTTKGKWQEVRLPLEDFVPTFRGRVLAGEPPLSASELTSIGFLISDKQDGPFRLEIGWIKAIGSQAN
jgi:monofunctional biosynthetic peptidoglycan transglycosylase